MERIKISKMKFRKDDLVKVISGNDKGKEGKILVIISDKKKVIIEGVNIIKKHTRAKSQTEKGGIISKEAAIPLSKIMIVCPSCKTPTRIRIQREEGKKIRKCAKCGAVISK